MLSAFSRFATCSRLSLCLIKQQCVFASSKTDSTSPKTGDTHESGTKDIYKPGIDSSQQTGTKTQEERIELEKEEQGVTPDIQTRQERKSPDQKRDLKNKIKKQ